MASNPLSEKGPLAGLLVLDLSHVLAGPFCTMLLADLGARVIKIEPPGTGDVTRRLGPFVNGISAYFATFNRGKESIVLDLKVREDRDVFEGMLEKADVLLENFTSGVMERMGYGWESLHARYPRLVYAAISGFGRTGPLKDRKANDLIGQAMGGIMSLTGPPGGPPTRVGTSVADITAGIFAALGITVALYHREKTGRGTLIDIAMMDAVIGILEHAFARYVASGEAPGPLGNRHASAAPFGAYDTLDGRIVVATAIDKDFNVLAGLLGRPDLPEDPRFATIALRAEHADALDEVIAPILRTRTSDEWLRLIDANRLRAAPILDARDIVRHPQAEARNMIVKAVDAVMGELIMPGNPVKMPEFPDPETRPPAPALGEHTARIREEFGSSS
jgi:CoA:oxalate CoA-transferase